MHHGTGGGAAHPFRGGYRIVTVKQGNPGADEAEHQTLDYAVVDIIMEIDFGLHLGPVGPLVHPEQTDSHEIAADHPQRAEHGGQQRHGDKTGQKAGRQNAFDRIHRHHLQA